MINWNLGMLHFHYLTLNKKGAKVHDHKSQKGKSYRICLYWHSTNIQLPSKDSFCNINKYNTNNPQHLSHCDILSWWARLWFLSSIFYCLDKIYVLIFIVNLFIKYIYMLKKWFKSLSLTIANKPIYFPYLYACKLNEKPRRKLPNVQLVNLKAF